MAHIQQTLAQSLMNKSIEYEWLEGVWNGETSIAIFNHDRRLSIHCHQTQYGICYCFFDNKISRATAEWRLYSIRAMMADFDRFVLWQYSGDLANNPYFKV